MKKVLILSFVFVCLAIKAQIPEDSVIMTVGGKPVSLAEFEFIAKKNNEADFSNEKALNDYIELFKNYKLKVAEAESIGIDKTQSFITELSSYTSQLRMSYLSDAKAEEEVVRATYDRGKEYLELSYIQFLIISSPQYLAKDTVEAYKQAMLAYERIKNGEDLDTLGAALYDAYRANEDTVPVYYAAVPCFRPMQKSKLFEDKAYSMQVGEITKPFRSAEGFSIIKLKARKPYPDTYRVAHVRIGFEKDSVVRTQEETLKIAEEVRRKALEGADFAQLAKEYSSDNDTTGILPPVRPGELVKPLEDAVYALANPGDVSQPILSEHGYHIFKLIEKTPNPTFEKEKDNLKTSMRRGELNFDLNRAFDERMKKEYNYTFYPEAYAELEKLAEDYFPSSNEFFDKAVDMKKTLVVINGIDFPQSELAYYMNKFPYSIKPYAGDFMKEVFDLFIRDIVTTLEKENMDTKHPEIPLLIQEYHDGILLFEISNDMVWNKPMEEQEAVEKAWIQELNKKYPVKVNKKLVKKLIKNNKQR